MSAHYAKKDQNEISTRKKKIKNSEINRKGKNRALRLKMNSYFAFLQRRKIRVEIPLVNELKTENRVVFKALFKYNSVFSKDENLKNFFLYF